MRERQGRKISLKKEDISLNKAGSLHDGNTKAILDEQLLPLESLCIFCKKVQNFSIKVGKNLIYIIMIIIISSLLWGM